MSRILVVDDAPIIRELLENILSAHGYEVVVASSADEAYRFLKAPFPDLILLDIDLPDVNGIELCRMIRASAQTRHIPIIMVTARQEEQVKGFQTGADDYVTKPFKPEELIERIRALLRRAKPVSKPVPEDSHGESAPQRAQAVLSQGQSQDQGIATLSSQIWLQTLYQVICRPQDLGQDVSQPKIIPAFLLTLSGFIVFGVYAAPGSGLQPSLVALISLLIWGVLLAVLVVSSSICGLNIAWRDGAQLLCLAGLPVLLKLAGGLALALLTSLNPFYYAAGPAMFFHSPPFLLARLDLFELWSAGLLWFFLSQRKNTTKRTATLGTLCVWIAALLLLAGASLVKR